MEANSKSMGDGGLSQHKVMCLGSRPRVTDGRHPSRASTETLDTTTTTIPACKEYTAIRWALIRIFSRLYLVTRLPSGNLEKLRDLLGALVSHAGSSASDQTLWENPAAFLKESIIREIITGMYLEQPVAVIESFGCRVQNGLTQECRYLWRRKD